ncbi:hypothetical protein ANACOL_03769 [Anaerotruncus colihominis DSM 17241]|uniref:Uncharacterized protein n=1 Tax=Anaerotruncus colihominis DSM 17241 TaxID=445972 RepID=B0PG37_9FIRM|nr:hypothetical protein ANACOL_03769 [Anaerotruncus colihominis DSM 17241]
MRLPAERADAQKNSCKATIFYDCDGYPLKRVSFCCIINRIMGMQA